MLNMNKDFKQTNFFLDFFPFFKTQKTGGVYEHKREGLHTQISVMCPFINSILSHFRCGFFSLQKFAKVFIDCVFTIRRTKWLPVIKGALRLISLTRLLTTFNPLSLTTRNITIYIYSQNYKLQTPENIMNKPLWCTTKTQGRSLVVVLSEKTQH